MYRFKIIILVVVMSIVFAQNDTTAPTLTYFTFTPDSVDVTAGRDTLTFTVSATDDLSGLSYGGFSFRSPSGNQSEYGAVYFEQGSLADTLTGNVIIDQYAEAGDWTISWLEISDDIGNRSMYDSSDLQSMGFPVTFNVGYTLSATEEETTVGNFMLYQNYPNPFNPVTNIQFIIPESGELTLKIFNSLGQLVSTPFERKQYEAGAYNVYLNLGHFSNGVYIYTLESEKWSDIKKMVILK